MNQPINKDRITALYARLMELAQTGIYPDGTGNMIEASLELLDLSAAVLGLSFRWSNETTCWVLEPMGEQEQAALIDALTDFAEYEQKETSAHAGAQSITAKVGRYDLEYKPVISRLRLSDKIWQIFITLEEARGIQTFLQRIVPDCQAPTKKDMQALIQVPQCAIPGCAKNGMFQCSSCHQLVCLLHVVDLNENRTSEEKPLMGCVACAPWNECGALDV